jgi:hypothetical protein
MAAAKPEADAMRHFARCSVLTLLFAGLGRGAEAPTPAEIRAAVEKAVPLLQKSAAESTSQRDCFMCHHQAVPGLALSLARKQGYAIDADLLRDQARHTETDLASAVVAYREGRGQGGGVTRAGYALWTLELGGWAADETTAAVTEFVLTRDAEHGHWRSSSSRPPSESSAFTSTFVALRALEAFGTASQKERIDVRVAKARDWLLQAAARDTEDRVFRLRALKAVDAKQDVITAAVDELLKSQREDGGWAQLDGGTSDAYATGSALAALAEAGGIATDHNAYRRGLAHLIASQKDDGSWYVKSRSKPFQTYFESGFPHGPDQFISIAATAWATAALALATGPR